MAQNTDTTARGLLLETLGELQTVVASRSMFPIFHRAIDSQSGIRITGKFKTTHSGIPSPMSYITVGRQSERAVVADGVGLAWRTGSEADGNYNIYFVDNNILSDDIPIRTENMVIEENINNFLGYGIADIEAGTEYKFGLEIDSNWGMKACIYNSNNPGDPNFSQPYNGATNVSGYRMSLGARLEGHEPQSNGDHFGIAVLGTDGNDWIYDDIRVTSIVDGHVAGLFKLHAADFSSDDNFTVYMKGAGEYSPGNWGLTWYIYDVSSSDWVELYNNITSSSVAFTYSGTGLGTYTDSSNFVNIMAMCDEASADGVLRIDYVKLTSEQAGAIHVGHMSDIYVHAPGQITRTSTQVTPIDGVANLSGLNHPIYEIEAVSYDAGVGVLTRDAADEDNRYVLINSKKGYTYSTKEDLSIGVPETASLDITYTYYSEGSAVQDFVELDDYRVPSSDNLVKISPPASITINNLEYSGAPTEDAVRILITSFVNSLVRSSFEVSDLIAYLYSNGVNYINTSTLSISVIVYDMEGSISDSTNITSAYSISAPNTFYTDADKLLGVTKV